MKLTGGTRDETLDWEVGHTRGRDVWKSQVWYEALR